MIKKHFKIGFIGTGNIANVHAESVRALKQLHLHSVYDPNPQAMERFAKKYDAKPRTLEDMLSDPAIDAIHILTPPDTHAQLLVKCANSGKALFVEKPIATTTDDIQALKTLQETNKSFIGVNQNMCFHPAFVELRRALAEGKHGALRQVEVTFRPPLRQLSAQQFSHWMFRSSLNLLLEQAVHPISQLLAMVGKPDNLRALPTDFLKINSDNSVCTTFSAALSCGKVSATFNFGVGALYPTWKISAYCDDAIIEADMITGICAVQGRSAFIDPVDHALSVRKTSKSRTSKARQHLVAYAKAIAGFGARSDTFYLGIKNSVEHFYGALSGDHPLLTDVDFGLNAVQVCYDMNAELAKFEPKKVDLPTPTLMPCADDPTLTKKRDVKPCLPITFTSYLELVDWTGRVMRQDKKGAIPAHITPILQQLGLNETQWLPTVSGFQKQFYRVAGPAEAMRAWCKRIGQCWFKGIHAAGRIYSIYKPLHC